MKQVTRHSKNSISVALIKFTIAIVLFCIATEFCNAQVTSTFNTDAEGWTMSDVNLSNPFTVNHHSTGGNPGGYVSASGASSPYSHYFTSPAKFNGNITYFSYGQDLKFDIQINQTGATHSSYGDVEIKSNTGSYLAYTLPSFPAVAPAWSTFTVRLDETSNWRINSTGGPVATKQQVLQFLSNVQSIRININYGGSSLTGAIDNVILQKRTIETAPSITSFTPTSGKPGTSVTINGANFDSSISQNAVYFGNVAGAITNASSSQLTVTIPIGAPLGLIKVLNKTTGLSKPSDIPFNPTFDGGGRIIPASFRPKMDIPTVQNGGLSVGDVDGDGWSDLILANEDNQQVEVHRNLGLGGHLTPSSFAAKVTFPTKKFSTNGAGMKVVDLDGDGKLDLTTSAWNGAGFAGGVFVTFRNISTPGNLAFESAEAWDGITDESPVYDVTDVDGDGLADLIGGEGGSGGTFWINQNSSTPGNIEFLPPTTFLGGTVIGNVNTATDLDNDGKPELIVVQSATITIIKNTSTPGIISLGATTILPYSGDSNVELYDFSGDGKKDLIFGNFFAGDDIRIRMNTNSGGALAISDFATEIILKSDLSYTNRGISLADMNGDGKVEIVAVDHGNIGVFENITNGTLSANSFIEAYVKDGGSGSTYPGKLVISDLNGDGRPDIVMGTTNASYRITIFENVNVQTPHISLNTVSPLKGAVGSSVTITGDFFSTTPSENTVLFGDVKAMVISATKTQLIVTVPAGASMAAVSVTRDQLTSTYHLPFVPTFSPGVSFSNAHFASPINFTLTGALYEVDAGDLNNDGKVDVVGYGDFAGNAISFRNTHTSGNISLSSLLADDTVTSVPYPRLFDLDGDGLMDMITASGSCRNVSVGSEIKFNTYAYISPGGYFYNDFADFNNDGKVDIVGIQSSTVAVNENRTTVGDFITTIPFATFSDSYSFAKPSAGGATVAADFDNDGLTDFAATNSGSDNVSIWKNKGAYRISTAQFTAQPTLAVGINPGRIYKGDFDVDGKVDLMLYYGVGTSSTLISVLHNESTVGNIAFTRFDFTIPASTTLAHVNDLDGDGKPDIIITSEATDQLFILKNTSTVGVINASSFATPFVMAVNNPRGITTADLNLDGKPEIIITSTPNSLLVFENLIPVGPSISINPQPASIGICEGTTTSFTLTAAGANNLVYQWQKFDGSIFNTISNTGGYSGTTTSTLSINTIGNFGAGDYRCKVSGDLASDQFSNTVTLTVNAVPTAPTTTGASNCIAAAITLNASGGINGQYRWYAVATGGTALSGQVNSAYTTPVIATTTTYYTSIHNGLCESVRSSVIATIAPLAKPLITTSVQAINGTVNICSGDVLTITAPPGFTNYSWSNGASTNPITIAISTSSLTLQVKDALGCTSPLSDALNVVVNPYPVAIITNNGTQLTASVGDNYQWYQNNNPVSGETNQSFEFNFLEYGVYKVDVTTNGCTATSASFEYLITGVENFGVELKIYPNPTDENLFIEFNPPYDVWIVDVTGKVVFQTKIETERTSIDLSVLSTGFYMLFIKTDHEHYNRRISKK
jgi:hypothetical protein